MKWSFENKSLIVGFGLASLLIGFVNAISYQNANQLIESSNKSKQTYEVIKNLIDVYAAMTTAESGRRGYVFLGDKKELHRHQAAIEQISLELQVLQQQVVDNFSQKQRLTKLESLILQRISLFRQSIVLYQRDKSALATQLQITEQSVRLRDQIQGAIAQMQNEEERSLQQWLNKSQSSIHDRMLIEFLVTILSFITLFVVYHLLYQQLLKRKQVEAIQRELVKEKEIGEHKLRFFSMISHEFRTPLSIILASSQLLVESSQNWSEERKSKNLSRILSSAKLMTQLLSDILTISRAEVGKIECNPKPIELESFCLNLIENIQLNNQNDCSIKFTSYCQYAYASLDEKLLYSILSNLLSNAVKYSAPSRKIHLILNCEPQTAIFQIKDEGIGISLEDQRKLYEPFYRGHNVNNVIGTGLGLAVVKKCLDIHQGEITVESEVGVGTTFTVKIPHKKA